MLYYVESALANSATSDYVLELAINSCKICFITLLISAVSGPVFLFFASYLTGAYIYLCSLVYGKNMDNDQWNGLKRQILRFWLNFSRVLFGYEVEGLQNLPGPGQGGALLVGYHGTVTLEACFLASEIYLSLGRTLKMFTHKYTVMTFGRSPCLEIYNIFTGRYPDVLHQLKNGEIVFLTPGAVYESSFGSNKYEVLWGNRKGFASLALEAKVPIIPVFTTNVREMFRVVNIPNRTLAERVYRKFGLVLALPFGIFPVKLKTYVGEPIPYDPTLTAEQLALKSIQAVENLIRQYQRIPGSIPLAILERIYPEDQSKNS